MDEESDQDLSFDKDELKENLPLTCLCHSADTEDEMVFDLSTDENQEVEESKQWSPRITSHADFYFDYSTIGPTAKMLPNKSALDFSIQFSRKMFMKCLSCKQTCMQHTNAGSLAIKKTPWTNLTVDEFETLLGLCETTFTERPLGSVITH